MVYGMPYEDWKARYQREASPEQKSKLAVTHPDGHKHPRVRHNHPTSFLDTYFNQHVHPHSTGNLDITPNADSFSHTTADKYSHSNLNQNDYTC